MVDSEKPAAQEAVKRALQAESKLVIYNDWIPASKNIEEEASKIIDQNKDGSSPTEKFTSQTKQNQELSFYEKERNEL